MSLIRFDEGAGFDWCDWSHYSEDSPSQVEDDPPPDAHTVGRTPTGNPKSVLHDRATNRSVRNRRREEITGGGGRIKQTRLR